jgi:hypothetical protein
VAVGATTSIPVPNKFEVVSDAQLLVPNVRELPVVVEFAPADKTIDPTPTEVIVTPAGIAGPITDIPATRPVVDGIPVTEVDPAVVFPVVERIIKSDSLPRYKLALVTIDRQSWLFNAVFWGATRGLAWLTTFV